MILLTTPMWRGHQSLQHIRREKQSETNELGDLSAPLPHLNQQTWLLYFISADPSAYLQIDERLPSQTAFPWFFFCSFAAVERQRRVVAPPSYQHQLERDGFCRRAADKLQSDVRAATFHSCNIWSGNAGDASSVEELKGRKDGVRWRRRRAPGETTYTLSPAVSRSPAVQNPESGFTPSGASDASGVKWGEWMELTNRQTPKKPK